jgi:CheY-like chemotaxis protein/anti-sigma regulatory factor (Ser/Thr protein kinase)
MAKVLVVDDSPVDRRLAGKLLESPPVTGNGEAHTGLTVLYAADGREALDVIARDGPDAVVTDLQMPGLSGLDLVIQVRARFPLVPVVLMTAHGSEELAVRALQSGAASYVPKRELAEDLRETVETVIEAAQGRRDRKRLMESLTRTESHFVLDNDPALIPPLVAYLKESVFRMSGSDETGMIQMTMALREALLNAMEHGNLELDSSLRELGDNAYHATAQERRTKKPYCDRRVHVTARESRDEAVYVIRDDGFGFDTSHLPDPTNAANLEKTSGRGLLLMRAFMSEVRHNDRGNEVTLIRRARGDGGAELGLI